MSSNRMARFENVSLVLHAYMDEDRFVPRIHHISLILSHQSYSRSRPNRTIHQIIRAKDA